MKKITLDDRDVEEIAQKLLDVAEIECQKSLDYQTEGNNISYYYRHGKSKAFIEASKIVKEELETHEIQA